jgi:hypothetical protein
MAFFHDDFEQHEKVEVSSRKINLIQHIAEIISLDSVSDKWDSFPASSTQVNGRKSHVHLALNFAESCDQIAGGGRRGDALHPCRGRVIGALAPQ